MTRATTQSGGDLTERVIGLEHGVESLGRRFGERLNDGAERFSVIRRQIEDIEARLAPKPADKWKAAGFVFGVAVALFTWVWQAARYPDRSEYGTLAAKVDNFDTSVRSRLDALRETQLRAQTDVLLMQRRIEMIEKAIAKIEESQPRRKRR